MGNLRLKRPASWRRNTRDVATQATVDAETGLRPETEMIPVMRGRLESILRQASRAASELDRLSSKIEVLLDETDLEEVPTPVDSPGDEDELHTQPGSADLPIWVNEGDGSYENPYEI